MTQIKKTLSIAGIIAMVGAPAMADIASTQYVQNIVNNIIPTSGTVGDVLKKTEDGVEWAAAPSVELKTTTGTSTTASMTQKAISDALDAKLSNNATDGSMAIGSGTTASKGAIGWDDDYNPTEWGISVAIGINADGRDAGVAIGDNAAGYGGVAIGVNSNGSAGGTAIGFDATAGESSQAIGDGAKAGVDSYDGTAIGSSTTAGEGSIAIGYGADAPGAEVVAIGYQAEAEGNSGIAIGSFSTVVDDAIQLGGGENTKPNTFQVWNYKLLDGTTGLIPADRISLDSILPTPPEGCATQKCALVRDATTNPVTYKWEVVRSTSSGQ